MSRINKIALLVVAVFLATGFAAAEPLENFNFDPDSFEKDIVGGDSFSLEGSFDNVADEELPLILQLKVETEEHSLEEGDEEAFNLEAAFNNDESLECTGKVDKDTLVYSCAGEEEIIPAESTNEFVLDIETHPGLASANYDFELNVKSEAAIAGETETITLATNENVVEIGNDRVVIDVEEEVSIEEGYSASVSSLEDVVVSPPSEDEVFVSGVAVDVDDGVDASGSVQLGLEDSDFENLAVETFEVYYYDKEENAWTTENAEIIEINTDENYVLADVDHFSMYALYAEREEQDRSYSSVPTATPESQEDEEDWDEETREVVQDQVEELQVLIEEEVVEGSIIEVTVTNENGDPVQNAQVTLDGESIGQTDENGVIEVEAGEPGERDLEFSYNGAEGSTSFEVQSSEEPDTTPGESEPQQATTGATGLFMEQASSAWYIAVLLGILGALYYYQERLMRIASKYT